MPAGAGPNLPYSIVAGVVPVASGWLVASAKLRAVTFAPEHPRLLESFVEVLDDRPTIAVVALDAPVGGAAEAEPGRRACDREAREILTRRGPGPDRTGPSSGGCNPRFGDRLDAGHTPLFARYQEVAREMAPYRQRSVFEVLPELSFLQLREDHPARLSNRSSDGPAERRELVEAALSGVARILDADLDGVRPADLLDAAACLWTARRIAARVAIRLPADAEWDEQGLRMEIVR